MSSSTLRGRLSIPQTLRGKIAYGVRGPTGPMGPTGPASTPTWGGIEGSLSDQTDLKSALDGKADYADCRDIEYANGYGPVLVDRTTGHGVRLIIDNGEITQEIVS